jgi:hypothetical protein
VVVWLAPRLLTCMSHNEGPVGLLIGPVGEGPVGESPVGLRYVIIFSPLRLQARAFLMPPTSKFSSPDTGFLLCTPQVGLNVHALWLGGWNDAIYLSIYLAHHDGNNRCSMPYCEIAAPVETV